MRVLLRNVKTRRYFRGGKSWNARAAEAFDFQDTKSAVRWATKAGKTTAEIVFSFEDARLDLVAPVKKAYDPHHWRKDPPNPLNPFGKS